MNAPHVITATVAPGDVVFDVGAHSGDKAQWYVDLGAKVVCVEPQPQMVEKLRQRFTGTANVAIVPKGLSDKPGVMTMDINTENPTLSTFAPHWKQGRFAEQTWDRQATVEITTLDDLIAQHGRVKYCKIDVEGLELQVISGLSAKSIDCLSYEFTGEFLTEAFKVLGHLLRIGYDEFNVSLGESAEFSLGGWVPFHDLVLILFSNAQTNPGIWGDIYAR